MKLTGDDLSTILVKQMDASTLRQRVIANNIANANTPGFKKSRVDFQRQLQEAIGDNGFKMKKTRDRHLGYDGIATGELVPEVIRERGTSMLAGKNNVDVDQEMVDLAANTLLYRLVTRISSDRKNTLSYVIKGGR